ncbi:hypothetical protein MCAMS1_00008 [biofilm metagenome]
MRNVLLVESSAELTLLESDLCNNGYLVQKIQYSPFLITQIKKCSPEILIFNIDSPSDIHITDLRSLDSQLPLPVIVFTKICHPETINKLITAEVSALIIDGLPCNRLSSIIQVAIARFKQSQALRQALEEARTQLEDRKQIERAKAILIKTQKFSEDEAYHKLRKLAMDRKISLGDMARNVIAMAELLN